MDSVIERIKNGDTRQLSSLQNLSLSVPRCAYLTEQLMDLCYVVDDPIEIFPILLSVVRFPEDEEKLVKLYEDLVECNRDLLLPIILSLSSAPFTHNLREKLLASPLPTSKEVFSVSEYRFSVLIIRKEFLPVTPGIESSALNLERFSLNKISGKVS